MVNGSGPGKFDHGRCAPGPQTGLWCSINQDGLVLSDSDLPASERERALMTEILARGAARVVSTDVEHAAADGNRRGVRAAEGAAQKQRAAAERQGRVCEEFAPKGVSDHVEPRAIRRRPKPHDLLTKPRAEARAELLTKKSP